MGDPGLALKSLRERAKLSLRDLAERTNVSASTLSRAENGHIDDMRFGDVVRVVTVLGGTVEDLYRMKIEKCPTCDGQGWIASE
jgi:transcriptional regulator with XRE-family HTH domain